MRHLTSLALGVSCCLSVAGCSSDDSPRSGSAGSSQTGVGSQQPQGGNAASNGGSGGGMNAAGSGNGGSSSEGVGSMIAVAQGGGGGSPATGGSSTGGTGGAAATPAADSGTGDTSMSFFVTSRGSGTGANFGGLDGADAFCATLAGEVSAALGAKTWRAYLSTAEVNARERIGEGPWRNAVGRIIADDLDQLHDQGVNGALNSTWPLGNSSVALDEQGEEVPNQPVLHDILTGTNADGTVSMVGTCSDWTSVTGATVNGHSNRTGGGVRESWANAHQTGCAEPTANFQQGTVSQGGGRGSIYCFAVD